MKKSHWFGEAYESKNMNRRVYEYSSKIIFLITTALTRNGKTKGEIKQNQFLKQFF